MIFDYFGLSTGAMVLWGFYMAFLLSAGLAILGININKQVLSASLILSLSYSLSDLFMSIDMVASDFIYWASYDVLTVVALFIARYRWFRHAPLQPAFFYCVLALSINAAMFFMMYVDSYLLGTRDPWLLWYIYSWTVISADFVMVGALITNRDFLALYRLFYPQPYTVQKAV
ncbi:hypothetical protein PRUB_a1715 [Pseudoalteromonas rubra]|uniref:Uncharacterized protein n=1 Tax=Pseudoalteromonas rubra TaxID=43658 RepID=A0A8T0CG53_9GAMM|nr:hypothetical protein [Pseudoalteromonas rubra]KAF7788681.1 hypothetical protein PRUB_a1715 [Pseudoalteromonas rubra]